LVDLEVFYLGHLKNFYTIQYNTIQSAAVEIRRGKKRTRMWANAEPDGRPAVHRWRLLFHAAKFG